MDEFARGARVGVVSRQQLVVEAVRLLLHAAHREVYGIAWHPPAALSSSVLSRFDVGLLVDDLSTPVAVWEVIDLLGSTPRPWLVLTEHPAGPAWGALLVRGGVLVRDAECGADEVVELVDELADPQEELVLGPAEQQLVVQWSQWQAAAADFHERLRRLSRREVMVLEAMDAGLSVAEIARTLGVSTGTVRTQVKSMRRKLGVESQLAAVAALHRYGRPDSEFEVPRLVEDGPSLPRPRGAPEALQGDALESESLEP